MMRRAHLLPLSLMALVVAASPTRVEGPPVLTPNPNTSPAGALRNGVLSIELDAMLTRWHREGGAIPGTLVEAFAEHGKDPIIPGPMIRVPVGTQVRMRVHNTLARKLILFLPASSSAADSIVIAPGATGDIQGKAATPGNFFYRANTDDIAGEQFRILGALAGAMVVDTAGAQGAPRDRVMMLLMTPDSAIIAGAGTTNITAIKGGQLSFTINGRSWPNTERISATVGDTLHWRVINASPDVHPMHLHGFYFRVDEFTALYTPDKTPGLVGRMAVTERMFDFSSMSMTWVPERAGNWIFHCHFAIHLLPPTPPAGPVQAEAHPAHENHALTGMVGLVMGINIAPRGGTPLAAELPAVRRLRLIAVRDSAFPEPAPSMRFVLEENGKRTSERPSFSPTIYLTRNEPVSITVVNQLNEVTGVHWHGIELPSYFDGVAGFSGSASRLAPSIAPLDSFEARFTPPRAGTFMYHSHLNEVRQQTAGMVGALVVRDGPPSAQPDDHVILLKGARDTAAAASPLEVNGTANPDTIVIHAGKPARFRLMSLALFNPNARVLLTSRPDSAVDSPNDTLVVRWRPIAKDGADLPKSAQAPRQARQTVGMGETYDFEYIPQKRGTLRIEVRNAIGGLLCRVPVRVE